jgi:hypothetical protein
MDILSHLTKPLNKVETTRHRVSDLNLDDCLEARDKISRLNYIFTIKISLFFIE